MYFVQVMYKENIYSINILLWFPAIRTLFDTYFRFGKLGLRWQSGTILNKIKKYIRCQSYNIITVIINISRHDNSLTTHKTGPKILSLSTSPMKLGVVNLRESTKVKSALKCILSPLF